MNQNIAIIVGISGVGKTYLLDRIKRMISAQVLSASQLILDQINKDINEEVDHDDLRTRDIATNQEALKAGFHNARDPHAQTVILDAHVIIDTPSGMHCIGSTLFADIGASLVIFLEQRPELIAKNRLSDPFRKRPLLDLEMLERHQCQARQAAKQVADDLGISYHALRSDDIDGLIRVLTAKKGS